MEFPGLRIFCCYIPANGKITRNHKIYIGADLMPKIIIFTDIPIEFTIEEGRTSIGRGSMNDITLDCETISYQHALITYDLIPNGQSEINLTDLGSTNGMYVNGNKTKVHTLQDSDQFTLGNVKCVYINEE